MQKQLTAIIEREGSGYVSLCPELDITSQGDTILIPVPNHTELRIETLHSIIRQSGINRSVFEV